MNSVSNGKLHKWFPRIISTSLHIQTIAESQLGQQLLEVKKLGINKKQSQKIIFIRAQTMKMKKYLKPSRNQN